MRDIDIAVLDSLTGEKLGSSEWHDVTQAQVGLFAEATGDRQWIHTDPERARLSPFGGPIAHGFLTLSLLPALLDEILQVDGCGAVVNYGLNKVRFPAPVPVGSRVRMHASAAAVEARTDGSIDLTLAIEFELEGGSKPCCVAESILRFVPAES